MNISAIHKKSTVINLVCLACMLLIVVGSCEKDYVVREPIPEPVVAAQTNTLEAAYVSAAPSNVNASFWGKVDYLKVTLANISTQNIYTDGLLNMTGTYDGLNDFSSELTLKAAYDNNNLYILAEWTDPIADASNSSWLWNGPEDPLKADSTGSWTSQRGNDRIAFAFEIDNASSSSGIFSSVGCAASCHNNAMQPQSGRVDIWNWSLALSEPMGYALDMVADGIVGLAYDAGQSSFQRNNAGTTDRSGPAYEWDGTTQSVTKPDGSTAVLDPAYFLINKTSFIGDPAAGANLYIDDDKGCSHCHGDNGEGGGDYGDGPAFTKPAMNRFSRMAFDQSAAAPTHTGQTYYNKLNASEKEDIIAMIRGLSGVPGYYLNKPTGSCADIASDSNVLIAKVSTSNSAYKVLLMRSLNTGNVDDVQFDLTANMTYIFGVALMDNDGKNHIGSLVETLTFIEQ